MSATAVKGADVLIVVPTLNEAACIESCLGSLMAGDARLEDALFVVADGGSSDGTCDLVRAMATERANLILMDDPKRIQAAAVNAAARTHGEGRKVLVRCDAHAVYPDGYVMQVADALVQRRAQSLVTCMDAEGEETCFQKGNAWVVDTPLGSGGSAHRGGARSGYVDHGHHAGFDLETFLALDGYDETFTHNEDAEYDHRVILSGGRIFLDAEIRMIYRPRANALGLARQYYNYGRGRARTMRKHGNRLKLRQWALLANAGGLAAGLALAPVWWLSLAYPAAYVGGLAAGSIWIAARRRSFCGLWAGPAAGVMHLAWAAGFVRRAAFPARPA